jgi:hypothetical protein
MAIQWFYQRGGRPSEPVDLTDLHRLVEAGIVRPNTLVRQGASGRWVRAENVQGLFQQSTPAPSSSPGASPPGPPPPPLPVPESGAPSRGVSGESPIRHSIDAAEINDASEKPERIRPVTMAAIIVGAGTVLLLLWAVVFRGGTGQQQAEKDQPPLAVTQSAEAEDSASTRQAVKWTPPDDAVVWTPEVGKSLGIPAPPGWQDKTTPATAPAAEPKSAPATGNVKTLELADLAELVGPSVVQVNVTRPKGGATGSGFVLDKLGTIVTNFHVIEDATAGTIIFSDRTSARITGYLGVWPEKDIALVRVECPPDKLHPLRLATSAPRQGERVAAFGSPLGLQQSVSEGIVSAVRESDELRTLGPIDVNARLIQTTTPISHGNSGGPLVDMKGLVVGVNTLTFRSLGGENVNFAVAAVELPPLLLAKNETPSPLPASDPAADGVRRILSRAPAHIDAGDYDSAIADYTEVIRLDPKNANGYFGRAWAYRAKREYDSAIADYSEVIRLYPKNSALTYSWRGQAYRQKEDYDSAIADFTEAIRLDPKNAEAYYARGLAYQLKGQRAAAAERDFAQAKRLGYKAPPTVPPKRNPVGESPTPIRRSYAGTGEGHWVSKNIGSGEFIVLEDGSLWEIDRLDRIDASLWLSTSDITVVESDRGSPGYDYLLINTDDGEKAHAKYMGKR